MNKKFTLTAFLFLSITLLSGCVYYRLLKLKWQLESFEENFELEDKKGLTIIFKNPVLTKDDIIWLMNNKPTSNLGDHQNQNTWLYILTKKTNPDVSETKNYDIDILMEFNDDKLKEATLPKRFLENLSKEMLAKMFRSIGKSKIDEKKKQADSLFKGSEKGIPTIHDILYTLGEPFKKKYEQKKMKLRYIYNLKRYDNNVDLQPFDLIFDFVLNNNDKVLQSSSLDVNGLRLSMEFMTK